MSHFAFRTDIVRIVGIFMNHVDDSPKEQLRKFAHGIICYASLICVTEESRDRAQDAWKVCPQFIRKTLFLKKMRYATQQEFGTPYTAYFRSARFEVTAQ
jgi:hypothetical protein